MENNGYLYVCYSKDGKPNRFFSKEFLVSYASLKKALPNCKVALYTNIDFENDYGIDHVIYDRDIVTWHIAKAYGLLQSPFDKTIFLDTDTVIHRPVINMIFNFLDEFSFAATYATQGGPDALLPDLNSGVIGVKTNEFTTEKIGEWINMWHTAHEDKEQWDGPLKDAQGVGDQYIFSKIFRKNKKEFFILPPHFHYRCGHFRGISDNAVLTHDHSMKKSHVTDCIIEIFKSYQEKFEKN